MDSDLRVAVQGQIKQRGCYIMARASKADLKDDDIIQLHTIGFHEHDAPELAIPRLPHRLLQRAGGLLAYVRNEKPVDQPLKEGEKVSVNGLHFTASHVKGQRLKDANFLGLVAVRAYYALKQSDGLVRCIELTLESGDSADRVRNPTHVACKNIVLAPQPRVFHRNRFAKPC